jgi:hypothetical protein
MRGRGANPQMLVSSMGKLTTDPLPMPSKLILLGFTVEIMVLKAVNATHGDPPKKTA